MEDSSRPEELAPPWGAEAGFASLALQQILLVGGCGGATGDDVAAEDFSRSPEVVIWPPLR
ncbi:hypothetical protein TIFTF001_010355 [Ficus carica]|uniref:Uncharacterized protein n=1 Tax=Ficus carica TaxID=3494 RepID=A0AA88CZT0_FICCA|nr:hypothetical protein TIFTF001_010355 [Ficus carica]